MNLLSAADPRADTGTATADDDDINEQLPVPDFNSADALIDDWRGRLAEAEDRDDQDDIEDEDDQAEEESEESIYFDSDDSDEMRERWPDGWNDIVKRCGDAANAGEQPEPEPDPEHADVHEPEPENDDEEPAIKRRRL